jgi:pimeloyl-ACP methyl ester carboxylesterase
LHAITDGPEDGPLVLLLHGFPEFWYGWSKQIGPLAKAGFRVVAPDQRGYNLSDKPRGVDAYRIDRPAADAAELIRAQGRERALVVGHDWGGAAAWTLAALHPERVEKLAILNVPYPPAALRSIRRDPSQLVRSLYFLFFQIPGLPEALFRNDNWAMVEAGMKRASRPGTFTQADFTEYRSAWWRRGAMTSMLNWYRAAVRRGWPLPWKPRIQPPALILWGKNDVALTTAGAEFSLELCADGRLEYLDAGHFVQHEEPQAVNTRLIEFFGEK